jgi:zinc transport system substrate-binding protein
VLDETGAQVGPDHACPGLHGEASSGSFLAIGCATGILLVDESGAEPSVRLLPYPEDFPADLKTGTLLGGTAMQYFLGNFGTEAVTLVDPAEDAFILVPLPLRRVHFALDPARPDAAYILTEDGTLHRLDTLTGSIEQSAAVTAAYSMDGHWNDPRPRIAVAGDEVVVTDPRAGLIRVLDAATLQERRTIEVEGQPFNIAVVGGSGAVH